MTKSEEAIKLFKALPENESKDWNAWMCSRRGMVIEDLIKTRDDYADYMDFRYGEFILFILKNFEEIMEDKNV